MAGPGILLITGANGYIGTRIVGLALQRGYSVRATVRTDTSATKLRATFPGAGERLTPVIVPDITTPEGYQDAFGGATAVVHGASPFILSPKNNTTDVLDPAIKGSMAILEAVKRYGPSIRRLVNISSFAAIVDLSQGLRPGYTYTEKDWNPMTYEEAAVTDNGSAAYCASKALAEAAMWKWLEDNKANVAFTMASINPPFVFGPYVSTPDLKHLSESMAEMWGLVDAHEVPPFDFAGCVDVRDVAEAVLLAVEKPEAGGQRFLVGAHFDWQTAADVIRKVLPALRHRIPEGRPHFGETEAVYAVDGSLAERVLGLSYTPLEVTLKESIEQFLEAEKLSAGLGR